MLYILEEEEEFFHTWTNSRFPTLTSTLGENLNGLKTVVFDYSKASFMNSSTSNFILKLPDPILFKLGVDISDIVQNNRLLNKIVYQQHESGFDISVLDITTAEGSKVSNELGIGINSTESMAIQKVLNLHPTYTQELEDEVTPLANDTYNYGTSSYYHNTTIPYLVERIKDLQISSLTQIQSIKYLKDFVSSFDTEESTDLGLVDCIRLVKCKFDEQEIAYKKSLGRSIDLKQQKQKVLKRESDLKHEMNKKVKSLEKQVSELENLNLSLESKYSSELLKLTAKAREGKKVLEKFIIKQCSLVKEIRENSTKLSKGKKKVKFSSEVLSTLRAHSLMDEEYYLNTYPDVATSKFQPHEHFYSFGFYELRNPSASFNTLEFIIENPEVLLKMSHPYDKYINRDG